MNVASRSPPACVAFLPCHCGDTAHNAAWLRVSERTYNDGKHHRLPCLCYHGTTCRLVAAWRNVLTTPYNTLLLMLVWHFGSLSRFLFWDFRSSLSVVTTLSLWRKTVCAVDCGVPSRRKRHGTVLLHWLTTCRRLLCDVMVLNLL